MLFEYKSENEKFEVFPVLLATISDDKAALRKPLSFLIDDYSLLLTTRR